MGIEDFVISENLFEENTGKDFETNQMPDTRKSKKGKLITTAHKKAFKKKEQAAEIFEAIGGLPKPGESIDFISRGEGNAGSFYELIRDKWGEVQEAYIATWIINRYYIDMLLSDAKAGVLKKLVFIISNRMRQLGHHIGNFNFMLHEFNEQKNISIRVANSHAKTYCMANGADFIVIDGSANWTDNPRLENYTITNAKEKFDFRKHWMTEIIEK